MTDTWVQRRADEYAQAIESELPTGTAWPRETGSDLMRWVAGCAAVWGDVDARAATLAVVESDPRSTFELLPDWERAYGLPDLCIRVPQTIEERRNALVAKVTATGGQSRAFFIAEAAALGYTISIYEFAPYLCGITECGDTRPDGALTITYAQCGAMECGADPICSVIQTGGDEWRWELGPPELRYFWKVKLAHNKLTWFRGGTGECGQDHHCEIGLADDLECLFRRYKPASSEVIFDYAAVDVAAAGGLDASKRARSLAPFLLLF